MTNLYKLKCKNKLYISCICQFTISITISNIQHICLQCLKRVIQFSLVCAHNSTFFMPFTLSIKIQNRCISFVYIAG